MPAFYQIRNESRLYQMPRSSRYYLIGKIPQTHISYSSTSIFIVKNNVINKDTRYCSYCRMHPWRELFLSLDEYHFYKVVYTVMCWMIRIYNVSCHNILSRWLQQINCQLIKRPREKQFIRLLFQINKCAYYSYLPPFFLFIFER